MSEINETADAGKVVEILCNSGEDPLTLDLDSPKEVAEAVSYLDGIVEQASYMLDRAYLNNVVVVRTADGKFHVGEFCFRFFEVTEDTAYETAKDFGKPEDEDEEVETP